MTARRPAVVVRAVCAGRAVARAWAGNSGRTAIDKRPVSGDVSVGPLGLDGDEQADATHGGPDQALYAYGQADADYWGAELDRQVPAGSFGENLRIEGLDVSQALVGERWRIGDRLEVQVTAPRIPCKIFAGFLDVDDLVPRFLAAGRPGAYLRVLQPGSIAAGDQVHVLDRPHHELTVAEVLRIQTRDRDEAHRLVELDGLASRFLDWATDRRS